MENEKRTDYIYMKILPSVKKIGKEDAAKEGRTLSNYIEKLIREAHDQKEAE